MSSRNTLNSIACPNSVYTDTGGRITIDIDDAGYSSLSSLFSVTWILGCQHNNSNMPDVRASATTASKSLFVCPLLADCCRIFQHDLVLVKNPISLVSYDENARSVPVQFGGQVRRESAAGDRGNPARSLIIQRHSGRNGSSKNFDYPQNAKLCAPRPFTELLSAVPQCR